GGGNFGNVADLGGEIGGHRVDIVGEVLPGATDARHDRLHTQFAFRSHFACNARDLRREGIELVHLRVNGVFQLQDFAFHVHRDLARQVAFRYCSCYFSEVADLRGQVRAHRIDRVGEVFPGATDAGHDCLDTQFAFRTHVARDARDLRRE